MVAVELVAAYEVAVEVVVVEVGFVELVVDFEIVEVVVEVVVDVDVEVFVAVETVVVEGVAAEVVAVFVCIVGQWCSLQSRPLQHTLNSLNNLKCVLCDGICWVMIC